MHSLLKRQVAKYLAREVPADLRAFLDAVDHAYHEGDNDRQLLERAMEISSQEMAQSYEEMRALQRELESRVQERTADLYDVNKSLEAEITYRKRTESENIRRVSELEALYENGLSISQLSDPKQIAKELVRILSKKLDWHHAVVRQYSLQDDRFEVLALSQSGLSDAEIEAHIGRLNEMVGNVNRGLSGWVIRNRQTVRSGQLHNDPRYVETYKDIQSGLYVPLQIGGEVLGSIAVESDERDAFNEDDERLLVTMANQAAIAMRNAELHLQTEKELEERKRAEEELRRIEEEVRQLNAQLEKRIQERTAEIESTRRRLELATTAAGLGIWEWDLATDKVLWDSQMYRIFGLAPGKFDEKIQTFMNFVHPDDPQDLVRIAQAILKKQPQYQAEYRIVRPDFSVRHIAALGVIIYDADQQPLRVIGVADDITPRKKAEQALRESETYARLLFDAAPDTVTVSDVEGVLVDVNQRFAERYHVNRELARGKKIDDLALYAPDQAAKRSEYVHQVMRGENVPPVELQILAGDSELHTLELSSYPLEFGGKSLVLSTARDITIHKQAEETLRLANAEMERALRIKDEFLASMSHELRTPLNAILGISESLEEQIIGALNEKQLKYLHTISESGRHLHELINDILDLSKVEAGRMDLNILDVQSEHLCQSSVRMVKELAQKKDLNLWVTLDPRVKSLQGDERRLKQVLVNLLSNAVKFTPPGKDIGLELQAQPEKSQIQFTVWDQGIGIAADDLPRLFKPFVQLDSSLSREYAGTGLGLALVAKMVRLHGGSVSVESTLGAGSRFSIALPWASADQVPAAQRMPEEAAPAPTSRAKRSGRILVVEDTETIITLMKDYLNDKGFEVLIARNGMEAVSLAKSNRPEIVLMDVMMPVMDGLDATREMRADETLKDVPIIGLTALAMPGDRERCFAAGMNAYLSKPVQFKELLELMDQQLRDRRGRAA